MHTRHARRRAVDLLRSRGGDTSKKIKGRGKLSRLSMLIAREMDAPQRSPLTGIASGHGLNSMPGGGIIKHS